jgi:hypothetical protein
MTNEEIERHSKYKRALDLLEIDDKYEMSEIAALTNLRKSLDLDHRTAQAFMNYYKEDNFTSWE